MRLHSPALAEAFSRGLVDEGCDVLDIGMVGTEMVYYAVGSRELDGGVSVTASHNPSSGPASSSCARVRSPLSGDKGIPDVQRVVETDDFSRPAGQGSVERPTSTRRSSGYVLGFIDPGAIRPMELVLDGGNGMAGPMIGPIIDSFPTPGSGSTSSPTGSSRATSRTRCSRRTAS